MNEWLGKTILTDIEFEPCVLNRGDHHPRKLSTAQQHEPHGSLQIVIMKRGIAAETVDFDKTTRVN